MNEYTFNNTVDNRGLLLLLLLLTSGNNAPAVAFGIKDFNFTTPGMLLQTTISTPHAEATIGLTQFSFFCKIPTAFYERHCIFTNTFTQTTQITRISTTRRTNSNTRTECGLDCGLFQHVSNPNGASNVFVVGWAFSGLFDKNLWNSKMQIPEFVHFRIFAG